MRGPMRGCRRRSWKRDNGVIHGDLMVMNGDLIVMNGDLMVINVDLASG